MIESFPFRSTDDFLQAEDFSLFLSTYVQLVMAKIPSSGNVYVIGKGDPMPKLFSDPKKGNEIHTSIDKMMLEGRGTSAIVNNSMLLAFQTTRDHVVVVVVSKVDPVLVQRAAADWLEETRESLLREFILVKQAFRDPETGLLNSAHLFSVLQAENVTESIAVILVELPARSRTLRDAFRNAQRAAVSLVTFTDNRFLLHHLGQCVFALLVRKSDLASVEEFSSGLVHFLKKENSYRVHIGSSRTVHGHSGPKSKRAVGEKVLDEAWTALQTAARRGPFSFCDYRLLADVAHHPLCPPTPELIKELRRISKNDEVFCVLKMQHFDEAVATFQLKKTVVLPEPGTVFGHGEDTYIYIGGYDAKQGLDYAHTLLNGLKDDPEMSQVYAGVSAFPFQSFTRSQSLLNARKATLHAEFFGPGHAVLFDAVSLNVSGDIYFSDGDLPKAVKEYRLGLSCDPGDVNLLNSLGVTYALLNKNAFAHRTFESVLEVDDSNYMALYNLGIGAQLRGELVAALEFFLKAHEYCDNSEEGRSLCHDLKVQLGQLYCQTGNYHKSLEYLDEWRKAATVRQQGRILRYLGEAYLESGEPREAMTWLQRALQQNERDHEILSLLGTAIWKAREGDDIALSLCNKSVELAPDDQHLRVRLARVQMATGHYREALFSLSKCRGGKVVASEVRLLKAQAYCLLQQVGRARFWARKVLQTSGIGDKEYVKAQALLEEIQQH
jgi:tetratricopeptide (TPR) repeat protein